MRAEPARADYERVGPAVEVESIRAIDPFVAGRFYVVTITGIDYPWPELLAGPFDTAHDAVEYRAPGTHVARAV